MIKGIQRSFIIELADGCKQAFPRGCDVYIKVVQQKNGIEGSLVDFIENGNKKVVRVAILTYGFLEIPYEEIISINRRR